MEEDQKENLFKIFGGFKRVSEESVIKTSGVGLGLSICKELVTFMGGTIGCASERNLGTTFTFSVKVACLTCRLEQDNVSG